MQKMQRRTKPSAPKKKIIDLQSIIIRWIFYFSLDNY